MPAPLRRSETLIQHPFRPPLTQTEYYAALKLLVPGCDPHELDIQLTAFYEQFKLELSTRSVFDPEDFTHLTIVRILRPSGFQLQYHSTRSDVPNGNDSIAPIWMFDPDERRDKLQHLKCYNLRIVIPSDDSCWARAYRSARGLELLLSDIRACRKPSSRSTVDTSSTPKIP